MSLVSPALAGGSFTVCASWEACSNDFLENSHYDLQGPQVPLHLPSSTLPRAPYSFSSVLSGLLSTWAFMPQSSFVFLSAWTTFLEAFLLASCHLTHLSPQEVFPTMMSKAVLNSP